MHRRCLAILVLVMTCCTVAVGQGSPTGPTPPQSLEDFLKTQALDLLQKRRQEVAGIKTPEQIAARREKLRRFFLASLGDMPDRTPLNPRVVDRRSCDGYRREKVIFESRPDHHVTAVLYLPEGDGPHPGVLVPCGHSANGKAYEGYQRACILLAKNGMAALCFDPIGQGERVQRLNEKGAPAIKEGSTTEHTMAGIGAILVGRQAASYRVWDAMRSLDYLASRPEVDPKRLGCTGNSGGGTETAYLMALDDRVAVAAPSCYITSLERLFATIGPQDAEQNITGQVAAGMDHADYVLMHAPKPTLLCVGTQDFFDIQGSWDTFREAKLLFGRLGFGERVDLFESDEPHGMTKPRREAAARWFSRWLLHRDEPITEPDFPVASDADLRCTRTGQVLSDLKGVSVFDLNARRAEELRPAREAFARKAPGAEFRAKVRELLGLAHHKPKAVPVIVERTAEVQGLRTRWIRIETEPGLSLTATDLSPEWPDRALPILLRLGDDDAATVGRSPLANRRQLQYTAIRGRRVVIANLRGLDPEARKGRKPSWFPDADVNASFLALHIGRPLLGQRTLDVLNLLDTIRAEYPAEDFPGFELSASGPSALAALHAAVLDDRRWIKAITLDHALGSWESVVKAGVGRGQLASAVPGVLAWYDLPDLVARLDAVPVTIHFPLDPLGMPLNQADVRTPGRSGH
ncbi:MAG: acetylxylan esterase [Isosphaeraceae bacterium]